MSTCAFRPTARPVVRGRSRQVVVASSAFQRVASAAATVALSAGLASSPALATVSFTNVQNNAVVESPVHLEFAVEGLTVKPAADGLVPGTGHFHVLIDEPAPEEGEAIPFDDAHKHYGKGQVADDIALSSGKHKLTLQFANAKHESYGSKFAQTITVTVQ